MKEFYFIHVTMAYKCDEQYQDTINKFKKRDQFQLVTLYLTLTNNQNNKANFHHLKCKNKSLALLL